MYTHEESIRSMQETWPLVQDRMHIPTQGEVVFSGTIGEYKTPICVGWNTEQNVLVLDGVRIKCLYDSEWAWKVTAARGEPVYIFSCRNAGEMVRDMLKERLDHPCGLENTYHGMLVKARDKAREREEKGR